MGHIPAKPALNLAHRERHVPCMQIADTTFGRWLAKPMIALSGLFLAAFIAATLIPAQSEAILVSLIVAGSHPVWLLLLVATGGNVLGAVVNWVIGRFLMGFADHPRFPFSPKVVIQAQDWYGRWGWVSLFGSWLPIVGDPLTLAAGVMREPIWRFILVVTLAKFGRYAVLAAVTVWVG